MQEKSRGLVAFAFNTDTTDYVSIATRTLKLASKTLGIPYTLITDLDNTYSNSRYDMDTKQFVQWRNAGRYHAYELSPYDETIVIDIDYLVFDKRILQVFNTSWDYCLMRNPQALTQEFPRTMGSNSLPYVWATVFAFRKTAQAEQYFNLIKRIQENYNYYRDLFNIEQRNYRNDYAFSIADIILNGYAIDTTGFPGVITHIDQPITSIQLDNDKFIVRDEDRAYIIPKTNIHVISKAYLQSKQFQELLDNVAT